MPFYQQNHTMEAVVDKKKSSSSASTIKTPALEPHAFCFYLMVQWICKELT
jgi:hypothetical protein